MTLDGHVFHDNDHLQLQRGQTYALTHALDVHARNVTIEATGTGPKPVIRCTSEIFNLHNDTTKITDICFDVSSGHFAVNCWDSKNLTMQRCDIRGGGGLMKATGSGGTNLVEYCNQLTEFGFGMSAGESTGMMYWGTASGGTYPNHCPTNKNENWTVQHNTAMLGGRSHLFRGYGLYNFMFASNDLCLTNNHGMGKQCLRIQTGNVVVIEYNRMTGAMTSNYHSKYGPLPMLENDTCEASRLLGLVVRGNQCPHGGTQKVEAGVENALFEDNFWACDAPNVLSVVEIRSGAGTRKAATGTVRRNTGTIHAGGHFISGITVGLKMGTGTDANHFGSPSPIKVYP